MYKTSFYWEKNIMYIKIALLFTMLFLHIVDDYYLQGFLASAKQKSWWERNNPDKLYSKDYIMALFEHAFSWTFMIMLVPTVFTYFNPCDLSYKLYVFMFCLNLLIHVITDDFKANQHKINLIQDQTIHIIQVVISWIVFILIN